MLVVADVDMLKQILVKDFSKFNARKASDQSMKIATNSKDDTFIVQVSLCLCVSNKLGVLLGIFTVRNKVAAR